MSATPAFVLSSDGNDTSALLDLVRWSAAQAVCVGHALSFFGVGNALRPPNAPYMQNLGVIVFFVLSGFLIAHALERAAKVGGNGFGRYLVDRFARIYAAFVPCLLVIAAIDIWLVDAGRHSTASYVSARAFFGSLAMMQNYPNPYGGSFEIPSFGSAGQLWSLAVEFHIYVFVGACFFALRAARHWWLCIFIAAAACVVPLHYFRATGVLTPGAALSWLWLAGFASYYLVRGLRLDSVARVAAAYAGAVVLFVAWWRLSPPGEEYAPRAYFVLACAFALLVLASQRTSALAKSPRTTRLLRILADYSFSLYLLHYTVLFAIHAYWKQGGMRAVLLGIVVSNVLALGLAWTTEFRHKQLATWLKQRLGLVSRPEPAAGPVAAMERTR